MRDFESDSIIPNFTQLQIFFEQVNISFISKNNSGYTKYIQSYYKNQCQKKGYTLLLVDISALEPCKHLSTH